LENSPLLLSSAATVTGNLWTLISQPRNANLVSITLYFLAQALTFFRLRDFSKRNVFQCLFETSLLLSIFSPLSMDPLIMPTTQLLLQLTLGLLYPKQLFLLALLSVISTLGFPQTSIASRAVTLGTVVLSQALL